MEASVTEGRTLPESERDMVWRAVEVLATRSDIKVAVEVPLLNRVIDLVYTDGETVVAVEFKRHDWKRALEQAQDHRLATEDVYVCLPSDVINKNVTDAARKIGVGILSWSADEPLAQQVAPEPSELPMTQVRKWLIEAFEKRAKEGARL